MAETNPCPCITCIPPKRKPGCHGSCPDYEKWNREHLAKKDKLRKAIEKQTLIDDYVIRETNKNMRYGKQLERAKRK